MPGTVHPDEMKLEAERSVMICSGDIDVRDAEREGVR